MAIKPYNAAAPKSPESLLQEFAVDDFVSFCEKPWSSSTGFAASNSKFVYRDLSTLEVKTVSVPPSIVADLWGGMPSIQNVSMNICNPEPRAVVRSNGSFYHFGVRLPPNTMPSQLGLIENRPKLVVTNFSDSGTLIKEEVYEKKQVTNASGNWFSLSNFRKYCDDSIEFSFSGYTDIDRYGKGVSFSGRTLLNYGPMVGFRPASGLTSGTPGSKCFEEEKTWRLGKSIAGATSLVLSS